MPPRKRSATTKAKGKASKVAKTEPQDTPDDGGLKAAVEKLKTADSGKKRLYPVDTICTLPGATVVNDYDCMLNQTNIGHNNNKFYVIQLLRNWTGFFVWTRWGRVGELGQNATNAFSDWESAEKFFCKKFTDKTRNKWEQRSKFTPSPGKYTLIEVEAADQQELKETSEKLASLEGKTVLPSKLDKATQDLVKLIFDEDMFKEQMTNFDIDVKKMPLGKLSKAQIAKGFEALEEIEQALKDGKGRSHLSSLSSTFYTIIPHSFGRMLPPVIDDEEKLQAKKDMLLVLGDIELTQSMQKEQQKDQKPEAGDSVPNPLDTKYGLLKCELDLLDKKSKEFMVVQTYVKNTGLTGLEKKLLQVWKMDREGEGDRFSAHNDITNRRLLWHGTNVAVVAAICKTGLRIMPHSGGRVGCGIYLASEQSKSHGYTRPTNKGQAVMFLNEAALGKEHHVEQNQFQIKSAPKGKDCVIAKGQQEPDPKKDTILKLDGHDVAVPQGKPVRMKGHQGSQFYQSEYLLYKESQNRMRYMCLFNFR